MDVLRLPGRVTYAEGHALQREVLEARIRGEVPDTLILLEHEPVITLGRKAGSEASVIDAGDWPVVRVERGGDATWHGPGQLAAYPIVALEGERRDLHRFLRALEDGVIALLAGLGLQGVRDARNTGVWLPPGPRKVCSIGIACRRWVTWHGLALNVDPDPAAFRRLRPCGFDPDVMTRLADHLDPCPSVDDLAEPLAAALSTALG
jgi:lipoate-protein ligase B